ncbi:GM26210 [Drosophila sechellia]|uniref:GM26210 n=1 Tax=Drosophila sechellia TaxID=7238 RepID=B4HJS3_DROSE|nr:GM26210 [Drosophila sechellia]
MRTEAAVSCFLLVLHTVCCQSGSDESWLSPDPSWSDLVNDFNQPGELCQCPASPELSPVAIEDAVALTYFKKFVNMLFQRKRFQYDAMSAVHKRSLLFSLLPSQLDELERVQNARDLDVLLTKILESAEEAPLFNGRSGCSYVRHGFFSLLGDIFKDVIELTKTTEELDIDRLIEVVNHHHEPDSSLFSRLQGYIYRDSPKTKKIDMIKPTPQGTPTIHQSINARAPEGDCISGDNLKMLLNVINVRSVPKESVQRLPAVSGVQKLEEAHESPTTPTKKENLDKSDSSNSSKSKSYVAEDEGFTLVDDHEDNNIDNV